MKKLKEFKYGFLYKNQDLYEGKIDVTWGKENPQNFLLTFSGVDKDKKEYEIEISLNLPKEELKKINDKFVNVNDKVRYIDFFKPDNSIPTIDLDDVNRLFSNPGNIWIKKEKEEYFMKLSVPEEEIFFWIFFDI